MCSGIAVQLYLGSVVGWGRWTWENKVVSKVVNQCVEKREKKLVYSYVPLKTHGVPQPRISGVA